MEKKKHNTKRVIIVLVFLVLFAIYSFISLRGEYLQILEIGENYTEIFETNLMYKYLTTGINFLILFLCIFFTTRRIKKGLKQFFDQEKKEMPKLVNKSIALIGGVLISLITSDFITSKLILAVNRTWFGTQDLIFGADIGYYMFQKPFVELIIGYIIALIIALVIYTVIYYIVVFNLYFDGIDRELLKKSIFIKQILISIMFLAVAIAAMTFVKSQDAIFKTFLTLGDEARTELVGAGVTDVTIGVWGYRIFAVVIVIAIFMAIHFFKKQQTKKLLISLATVPGYLMIFFLVMSLFQAIFISPNKLDKEKQYIAENIKNTRDAYQIDIEEISLESTETITREMLERNESIVSNIPIVSEAMVLEALEQYQTSSGYYSFRTAQLAKYNIENKERILYLSPREIVSNGERISDNKLYKYTHGYGTVLTSATTTNSLGGVEYLQNDIDQKEKVVEITNPRIYFGMEESDTIITNTQNGAEYDYPITTNTNAEYTYSGEAGIQLGFLDRLILGISKQNINIPFASNMTDESKILINRNILERAKTLMPYLLYDDEPYMVVREDGSLVWVIDAYTTSNYYPYSQSSVIEKDGLRSKINYIRNSAKVIVDAYDGTITFYITDKTDPIIMAYWKLYPCLFTDEAIPADIAEHIVYPQFLYQIQAEMLTRYHNIETEVLYRNDDTWEIAKDTTTRTTTTGIEMEPYYTMVNTDEGYDLGLIVPYTPYGKQNMTSYLVGTYENGNRLKLYKFSTGTTVLGPMQLNTQIEQDATISKELETLNVTGSRIIKDMLIIPVEDTLLYVEPIYQVLLNESDVPLLKKVIVASGNKVAIGDTLEIALENLLSQDAVNIEIENTDNEEDLIEAIIKANNNLEESSLNNDWEMIGKDLQRLQELIQNLESIRKQEELEEDSNTVTDENITSENNFVVLE